MTIPTHIKKSFADIIQEACLYSVPIEGGEDEVFFYNYLNTMDNSLIPLYLGPASLIDFTMPHYEKRKVVYVYFMMQKPIEIIEAIIQELKYLHNQWKGTLPELIEWTSFFRGLSSYKRLNSTFSKEDYFIPKLNKI